jgi:hypothetical protein
MNKIVWLPALAAGAVAASKVLSRKGGNDRPGDRWLTVTVNRPPQEVFPGAELPPPLDAFAERIDVEARPAPGDRGTELAVRPRRRTSALAASLPGRLAGQDPRQELRVALREAKSLLETGEVMRPDAPSTTHDRPGGKVIGLASRRSGGEGVL